jgi:hypothetical protein
LFKTLSIVSITIFIENQAIFAKINRKLDIETNVFKFCNTLSIVSITISIENQTVFGEIDKKLSIETNDRLLKNSKNPVFGHPALTK